MTHWRLGTLRCKGRPQAGTPELARSANKIIMETQLINLEIINTKKAWVVNELDGLIQEWESWQAEVAQIKDHPFDTNAQSDVFADGEMNMEKHEILQAKTLTFLNNNIKGHDFIVGFDGKACDRTDLRLKIRVKHRLHQLKVLRACIEYAWVPEAEWVKKSKEIANKIADVGAEAGSKILLDWMKNPF